MSSQNKIKSVIIAGGGTGGHVYPALSMADALCKKNPNFKVTFVGTKRGIESKVIPKTSYHIEYINMGMFNNNVNIFIRIKTLLLIPFAFLKSIYLILKIKPQFVIGVGGYASVPIVLIASFLGVPTFIWEPNAFPGMANRFLSKFAGVGLVVFEKAQSLLKTQKNYTVGMPIRSEFEDVPFSELKKKENTTFNIFIFGGSQGARSINQNVSDLILKYEKELKDVYFVHQTGRYDFEDVSEKYKKLSYAEQVECLSYIDNMKERYLWADLVICRSGTGSLSELAALRKPCILIPYPYAADNHQQKNAELLVEKGAAQMILHKDLSAETLKEAVISLVKDKKSLEDMSENIKLFYQNNAAKKIVEIILKEIEGE